LFTDLDAFSVVADDRVLNLEVVGVLLPVLLEAGLVAGAVVGLAAVTCHLKEVNQMSNDLLV